MPGWHEETRELQEAGRFRMLGIVEEQHPERAQLFMQWKQMDWPILVDAQNLLEVPYVPITLGIDEHGVVQYMNPPFADASRLEEAFLDRSFDPPEDHGVDSGVDRGEDDAVLAYLRGEYDSAVEQYATLIEAEPENGWYHFRQGVALRSRFESEARQPHDFQAAVSAWNEALAIDPNNYIWRRRIQQYGPRLDKPYPFYDWVREARADILARGDEPVALPVEPRGAEFAGPALSGSVESEAKGAGGTVSNPDPGSRITRDTEYVDIRPTVVAHSGGAEKGLRIHLELSPRGSAHWNNEVDGVQVWLETPEGWSAGSPLVTLENPRQVESRESRYAEFDLRPVSKKGTQSVEPNGDGTGGGNADGASAPNDVRTTARGFALYYVCEDRHGVCLYRRQDFSIDLNLGKR